MIVREYDPPGAWDVPVVAFVIEQAHYWPEPFGDNPVMVLYPGFKDLRAWLEENRPPDAPSHRLGYDIEQFPILRSTSPDRYELVFDKETQADLAMMVKLTYC